MASRTVLARLVLDGVEGVITGFKSAGQAAVNYGNVSMKAGDKAMAWVGKHEAQLGKLGTGLVTAGAVGVAALGGLTKVAIDWESAWAGVTKTVDGTPEQLASIEQGLRDMTKVLPASHEELAAVAEAAGQLGVKTDDVLGFTRTMVDLGETTNLSSEEAATSLQQMMNVMGTAGKDVDRLGSTIVALGNNGASTERDIVQMGQRIAAAGGQIGMSETDVLAFASSLASVGIEAEAGGSAISLTFKQIDADVREGGKQLKLIAETAGMTAEEFTAAWKDDPATAIASFVEGMGEMQASGEDVNGLLKELDISGIRQTDSLLRLAAATKNAGGEQDLLREQLKLAGIAWDDNSALALEAAQRYETRAAQAQMAINSIKDEAITLGQTLLPVFDGVLAVIGNVVDAVAGLPQPAKDAGLMIAAIASAGALAAGGLIKLVTGLANAKAGMQALGITARTATLAMGAIGLVLTAAGIALSVWMGKQADAKAKADAYTAAIKEQGEVIGESSRALAVTSLQDSGVLDLAEKFGANLADVTDAALGSSEAMDRVTESVMGNKAALEQQMAVNQREIDQLVVKDSLSSSERDRLYELQLANSDLNTELTTRASNSQRLNAVIGEEAGIVAEATDAALQHEAAMGDNADASKDAADAAQEHADKEAARATQIAASEEEMREALETAQAYGNALLSLSGSQIGVEKSITTLTERLAELKAGGEGNEATLNLQTAAGIENQEALDGLARSSMGYVQTLHEQGASSAEIAAATERAKEQWLLGAAAMGMESDAAIALADDLFAIPTDVNPTIALEGVHGSKAEVDDFNRKLESIPEEEKTDILAVLQESGLDAAEARLNQLARDRTANVHVTQTGGVVIRPTVVGGGRGISIDSAKGNIIDYYATGGLQPGPDVANRHLAGIAPAGSMRLFAEPETKGEAYIPFREDTRPRSIAIWRETGRRLGVQGFARGGINGGSSSTATYGDTHVHITQNFPGVDDVVTIRNAWQDAARQARLNGRGR